MFATASPRRRGQLLLRARSGLIYLNALVNELVVVAVWLAIATLGAAPSANAKTFTLPDGRALALPDRAGVMGEPALSPDGRQATYLRASGPNADDQDDPQPTDIVVVELPGGRPKVVIRPTWSYFDLRTAVAVTYAADGRHLYIEADCPCDSHSIHEIDPVTGTQHRIAWGVDMAVLRDGPWKGDLLIGEHTCYPDHSGCDYPVHVVTPAGDSIYVVPGTAGADRSVRLKKWLSKKGWRAW